MPRYIGVDEINLSDVKERFTGVFPTKESKILLLIALVVLILNSLRLFTNCFWFDETYSILLARKSFVEIIINNDVHPPLYYLILSTFIDVFGNWPFIYHLVSYIPYLLIVIVSITYVYRRYGVNTSIFTILFTSFLSSAMYNMVEVRMYEWALFFIFCSYLMLREVLENPDDKKFSRLFVLSSVLAAYTHYYCLLIVAFFYLVLVIRMFYDKKQKINTCSIIKYSILGYLPWIAVVLLTVKKVADGYWIKTIPEITECLSYMFSFYHGELLFVLMLILVVIFFIHKYRNVEKIKLDAEAIWIVAGLLSIFGTIIVSILISNAIRPVLMCRYLYPVSIVAWIIFGYTLPRMSSKKIFAIVAVSLVVFSGNYVYTYNDEMDADRSNENILACTSEITKDDTVYTNIDCFEKVIYYYYPNTTCLYFEGNLPILGEKNTYWFFLNYEPSDWSEIEKQGFNIEFKVQGKFAGMYYCHIYKATRI